MYDFTTEDVLHEVLWSRIDEAKPKYRRAFEAWLSGVKAEAWDEGKRSADLEYEHIFNGHPVPEGEMCDECLEAMKNPYREEGVTHEES